MGARPQVLQGRPRCGRASCAALLHAPMERPGGGMVLSRPGARAQRRCLASSRARSRPATSSWRRGPCYNPNMPVISQTGSRAAWAAARPRARAPPRLLRRNGRIMARAGGLQGRGAPGGRPVAVAARRLPYRQQVRHRPAAAGRALGLYRLVCDVLVPRACLFFAGGIGVPLVACRAWCACAASRGSRGGACRGFEMSAVVCWGARGAADDLRDRVRSRRMVVL